MIVAVILPAFREVDSDDFFVGPINPFLETPIATFVLEVVQISIPHGTKVLPAVQVPRQS